MFSCDIAYPSSPTALRGSLRLPGGRTAYPSTSPMMVSGRTPSYFIASAASSVWSAACQASMLGTSTIRPTRLDPSGSRNARAVIPSGPKYSSRFGEASQWSTSSTSWNTSSVGIGPPEQLVYDRTRPYRVCLLLQPHGFEGIVAVGELFNPRDLAVSESVDLEDPSGNLNATSPCVPGEPGEGDQGVAVLANGLGVHGEVVPPRLPELVYVTTEPVETLPLPGVRERRDGPVYEVGREKAQHDVNVTPARGFDDAAHNVHVLLRHRLLRQPHGFEGLRLAHVELLMDHQSVLERIDPSALPERDLDARGASAHLQVEQLNYAIPRIDQLIIESHGLPGGQPLLPEPHNGISASIDPGEIQYRRLACVQFDSRVPDLGDLGEHAAPVVLARTSEEFFDGPAHGLHVLLRHRLLLEAEVGEPLLGIEVDDEPAHLAGAQVEHVDRLRLRVPELQPARLTAPAALAEHKHTLAIELAILVRHEADFLKAAQKVAKALYGSTSPRPAARCGSIGKHVLISGGIHSTEPKSPRSHAA